MANVESELRSNHLLLAEFHPWYANAFMVLNHVATAGHVADATTLFSVPHEEENGYFTFQRVNGHDVGLSEQVIPGFGFEHIGQVHGGDAVVVSGHHGIDREYFEIEAVAYAILEDGRIVLARVSGKKFQVGMSGSPALGDTDTVVGILVEGYDEEDFEVGDAAIFEPAQLLYGLM